MRNLLLSLMVLASLVSCGKDNKVDGVNSNSSNAITLNDPVATQLGTVIDNSASYFAVVPTTTARYTYATTTANSAASNCETKTGWFGIKYYVCSSSNNSSNITVSAPIVASSVDLTAKRNELKGYINSSTANGGIVNGGSYYMVRTAAGVIYTIDLRYPIQVNPVSVQQANGQITYLYNVAY